MNIARQKESRDLAGRFFAYIQLRNIGTVVTGDLTSALAINPEQERQLLSRLAKSGKIARLRRGVYLIPPRMPAGPWSPGVYLALQELMATCRGTYQICGPTAFNFYRFSDQIPNITYAYNNRISGQRTIGNLRFILIKVSDNRLGATYTFQTPDGAGAVYSSKARTVMDAVYDWSRFNSLPRGYDWITSAAASDDTFAGELAVTAARFGNQATIRRIGCLLDSLGQPPQILNLLTSALSSSTALIPWIPGRPARGSANRKWGVIINE